MKLKSPPLHKGVSRFSKPNELKTFFLDPAPHLKVNSTIELVEIVRNNVEVDCQVMGALPMQITWYGY